MRQSFGDPAHLQHRHEIFVTEHARSPLSNQRRQRLGQQTRSPLNAAGPGAVEDAGSHRDLSLCSTAVG